MLLLPQNSVGYIKSSTAVSAVCCEHRRDACSTFQIQPHFAVIGVVTEVVLNFSFYNKDDIL